MAAHRVTDPEELAELYVPDRGLHIYALADLEEPYWSASSWWRDGDAAVGLVSLPGGEGEVVYSVSSRDPQGSLRLLGSLVDRLVPGTLVTGPIGVGASLASGHRVAWNRTYHRYLLTDRNAVGPRAPEVIDLGPGDVDELLDLYEREPGAAFFRPSMLRHDTFAGIRRDGRLVAVAGTHVFSERFGVAALGAVVTDPDFRRDGLGREVTRGVLDRLGDRVEVIGLNCADRNTAAQRLYTQLGFEPALGYEEAELS
jgi:ribosomal protein S18 acetylase RimI-like enzyme